MDEKRRVSTVNQKLTAWLQLHRVPNLFTVPGDPLAGFCLASVATGTVFSLSLSRLYIALLVSMLSYCTGLLLNDYFDLEEDRQERPSRPLPSNDVMPLTVVLVASLYAVAALAMGFLMGLATGIPTAVLIAVIIAYDYAGKRAPVIGPILMGSCRGLNLLLGASVLGWSGILNPAVVISAILITVYIAIVTHIAASETKGYRSGALRWAPGVTLVVWFLGLYFLVKPPGVYALPTSLVLAFIAAFWTFYCGSLLGAHTTPAVVQQTIGRFLRGLLLIQAALIAIPGYSAFIIVLILLAAWPVAQIVGKRFYAS